MKKVNLILALGLAVVASTAFGASPANLKDLRSEYETPAVQLEQNRTMIYTEAMKDPAFFATLKANNWTFDGVQIGENHRFFVQLRNGDFEDIDPLDAAKAPSVSYYKQYVAGKVGLMGTDTIEAYDWLQAQRLVTVQVAVPTSAEKDAFLADLAAQVLAAAKAKQ